MGPHRRFDLGGLASRSRDSLFCRRARSESQNGRRLRWNCDLSRWDSRLPLFRSLERRPPIRHDDLRSHGLRDGKSSVALGRHSDLALCGVGYFPRALEEATSKGAHPFIWAVPWRFISRYVAPLAIAWILIMGLRG